MINVKELRIGNILYFNKPVINRPHVLEVKGIYYDDQIHNAWFVKNEQYADVNEKGLSPIPIAPEWLERCDFIGLYHLGRREYSLVVDDELTIEVCFGEQLIVRLVTRNENCDENINLGEFLTYRHIRSCNYLHQLQNLYFALTGEELTIKESV